MRPWLGVVADDFTGACDLADAVSDAGASAVVYLATPAEPPDGDCAVVALKSRTAPVADAVARSVAAARWLLAAGCTTLYQKYCSTFDSTDAGNIGPVADALAALAGGGSVGTPATPRVGRTVYKGHLFVGRQLLSESPLRHHPVTPMRDPDLVRVLGRQAVGAVAPLDWTTVARGVEAVAAALDAASGHVIVDALTDGDLDTVAAAVLRTGRVLVGGAAGLAAALARVRGRASAGSAAGPGAASTGSAAGPGPAATAAAATRAGGSRAVPPVPPGRRLILSGSCSARTREQVAAFPGPVVPLSPADLDADFAGTVDAVLRAVADGDPVLVSSSAGPEEVAAHAARLGAGRASELLERATADIAVRAVDELGVRRLLVAGGETSGAVVGALGIDALRVGPAVGPGLPWMVPDSGPRLALLLKSGNFGEPDLFTTAWNRCP